MLAAPTTTSADTQSPARASRAARRNATTAINPPTTSTTAVRTPAGTANRISAPFSD